MTRRLVILIMTAALLVPATAFPFDEVQSRLLGNYGLPLRWYNVERAPLLMEGRTTVKDSASPRRLLQLAPGESATIWLPAWESLRLDAAVDNLAGDDLDVSFSTGGGLFHFQAGIGSVDGKSRLFSPASPSPLLARITRASRQQTNLAVAVFVSYREPLGEIAPYRKPVSLPLEPVMLDLPGRLDKEMFWHLPAAQSVSLPITGPVRIALENHLVYPEQESRRSFVYRVEATIDGQSVQPLEFETGPDMEPERYARGQRRLLGRLQTGYLQIPPGEHSLNLKGSVPLYARLLVQERPDYLLPELNAPTPSAAKVEENVVSPLLSGSFTSLGVRELSDIAADRSASPVTRERAAIATARDNGRRDGGSIGVALLRETGQLRPDYPEVRNRAEEFAGYHTYYRDLLPETTAASTQSSYSWFLPSRLAEPDTNPFGKAAGEQHMTELAGMLSGGTFFTAPEGSGAAYRYPLPDLFAPVMLRVAVPTGFTHGESELAIQFDDAPPERLLLATPPQLPSGSVPLSPAETGLLMLADSHDSPRPVTLGGAFSAISTPAPLVTASVFELLLPPRVTGIRLWKNSAVLRSIPVALQYRAAAPYRLAETEFIAAESLATTGKPPFTAFTALLRDDAPNENGSVFSPLYDQRFIADKELASDRLPLIRLIRSLERSYAATVARPPANGNIQKPAVSGMPGSGTDEKTGDWLTIFERAAIPARSDNSNVQREGIFRQIEALKKLGEDYLAEHRLKGLLLYSEDNETRSRTFSALEQLYGERRDLEALLSLQATTLVSTPTTELLRDFGMSLLESGEQELALQAFLILPPAERPRKAMLQSAWRAGWWRTFESILAEDGNAEERSFWQGLRAMADGRTTESVEYLRASGSEGAAWVKHLDEGLRIRATLADPDPSTRLAAIVDWEQWQTDHPGPREWRAEKGAVTTSAGAAVLTNVSRDSSFPAYRANAEQPVVLRLAGPVKIRIEGRPIHTAGSRTPLEGWLQIRDGERLYVQPIIRNMPAQGLSIIGDDHHAAGFKVVRDLDLGPGIHDIQVSGGALDLFVRVEAFRPALPIPLLSVITEETINAGIDGLYTRMRPADIRSIPENERIFKVSRNGQGLRQIPFTRHNLLQSDDRPEKAVPDPSLSAASAKLASLRPAAVAGTDEKEALLLGRSDLDGAFTLAVESGSNDIVRQAITLLWVAEQKKNHYLAALSFARALLASNGGVPGLSPIVDRLSRRGSWIPVTTVASSAGLRYLDVTGWQPESPELRVRRALLPSTAENEQILYDTGRIVLTLENKSATVLEVTLVADELAYLPPQPLVISYQLDRLEPRRLTLRAGEPPNTVSLKIPPGEHIVRIGIEERFADQFLRIGLREQPERAKQTPGKPLPIVNKIERPYHVATRREPILLRMEGPAILRIDEMRNGFTTITYRTISAGLQKIEIMPEKGQDEGLYRFFTYALVVEKPLLPVRYVAVAHTPVPPPTVTLPAPLPATTVRLSDAFTPGRQEDGTWSATGTLVRRKPVQEEGKADNSPEQFLENSATYRYFNGRHSYYESGALARIRENGSPTLGLQATLRQRPPTLPFTWSLGGNIYMQHPDGETFNPLKGSTEMSAYLKGSIYQLLELSPNTWHRPSFSLFGRALSKSGIREYNSGTVDQDIFTTYKRDHLYGASLSESILHRPWLDTLLLGTISLTSNEFDELTFPDNLSLALEWKQLLGSFKANAGYRTSLYISDKDRNSTLTRNSLGAEITYSRWLGNLDRLELGARIAWHFESKDLTSMLTLTWHFANGRGFYDFSTGEIDFRDLLQRMMPTSRNNGMVYESN